jgi:hypothetical protein
MVDPHPVEVVIEDAPPRVSRAEVQALVHIEETRIARDRFRWGIIGFVGFMASLAFMCNSICGVP